MSGARRRRWAPAVACMSGLAILFAAACPSAGAAPKLGYVKVASARQPTSLGSPPGYPRMLFVAERAGKIRILRRGRWLKNPLLSLNRKVSSRNIERGLLGLAFPPDFRKTGRFYVDYTARNGNSVVAEYRTGRGDPTRLRPGSGRVILEIPRVNGNGNHNGGHLAFRGNLLYIAVGDGFDPGDAPDNAQNLESLRGKILRIDPRPDPGAGTAYRIPPGNPFVGRPGRDEIFAYGLRNPFTFSFFDSGGQAMMSIADVGQLRYEELNVLPFTEARGANFGWKGFEGFEPFNCGELCPNGADPLVTTGLEWPQLVYSHEDGCAIIGGLPINDPKLGAFRGRVIYGDFCTGRVRTAAPRLPTIVDDRPAGFSLPSRHGVALLNGFGTDGLKRLYAFSHYGGIYRIIRR